MRQSERDFKRVGSSIAIFKTGENPSLKSSPFHTKLMKQSLTTELLPLLRAALFGIISRIRLALEMHLLLREAVLAFLDMDKFLDFHDLTRDGGRDAVEDCCHTLFQAKRLEDIC